ncbi:MAG: hypothetical protein ACK2T3_06715 [Candidatus Promineifilaceae bacterium]|jgi:hypothetical protein
MDDPYIIIGLVGSLASVAGLAISAPTAKSRFVHAIYGFVISVVAGGAVLYGQSMERQLEEARRAAEASKSEIARLSSIQAHAESILDSMRYTTTHVGENRGFILATFTFLETHKDRFPEAYEVAKRLVMDGLRITESAGSVGTDGFYDERKRMEDGATTMRQLLKGIASPRQET